MFPPLFLRLSLSSVTFLSLPLCARVSVRGCCLLSTCGTARSRFCHRIHGTPWQGHWRHSRPTHDASRDWARIPVTWFCLFALVSPGDEGSRTPPHHLATGNGPGSRLHRLLSGVNPCVPVGRPTGPWSPPPATAEIPRPLLARRHGSRIWSLRLSFRFL